MRRATTIRVIQTIFAILCITTLLHLLQSHNYITRYTSAPFISSVQPKTLEADEHIKRVRDFWAPFEHAVRDAKPSAQKILFTHGHAGAYAPEDHDAERTEPQNLVSNPEVVDELAWAHKKFRDELDSRFDAKGHLKTSSNEGVFNGSGVVLVAGGEYFGPAIVGIQMLRRTGSTLPVEAFVADADEYEVEVCEKILPALNARCINLTDLIDTSAKSGLEITHYQLKALAILFSSFNHVFYLDSDSVPLVDPQIELFAKEPYLSKGLVNWPDFWRATESPLFYRIAGLSSFPQGLPATSTEAGQLLVDKTRHLKTLLLAAYYNIYGPKWYYPLLSQGALGQGDKNTFESAAIVLGLPWYRVRKPVDVMGRFNAGEFKGSAMIQFNPADDALQRGEISAGNTQNSSAEIRVRPAFIHANTPKLNAGHLADEGDLQDSQSGERIRLWGSVGSQVEMFGFDVEMEVFKHVIQSGCTWGSVLNDWKQREDLCNRLKQHYQEVFHETLEAAKVIGNLSSPA